MGEDGFRIRSHKGTNPLRDRHCFELLLHTPFRGLRDRLAPTLIKEFEPFCYGVAER